MRCYAIYDKLSESYGTPFFAKNVNIAKRMFAQLVRDGESWVYKWPADFDLYYIGDYAEDQGILQGNDRPIYIANGLSYKEDDYGDESDNILPLRPGPESV